MKLSLSILLVVCLALSSAAEGFTTCLRKMNESELVASTTNSLNLRFIILPTWGNPVSIRIQQDVSGFRLTAKRLEGQAGYKVGNLVESKERILSQKETKELLDAFWKLKFFQMDENKPDENGFDGETWLLEGLQDGRLHKVKRWSANYDMKKRGLENFVDFCGLIVKLANLQEPPKNKGCVIFGRNE